MTTLILCAGEAVRFEGALKQFLPVPPDDTPLLVRTIRQLNTLRFKPIKPVIVMRNHEAFLPTLRDHVYGMWSPCDPLNHSCTVDTLLSTSHLWHGEVVVLLGDVLYSNTALSMILDMQTFAAGNIAECFALRFDERHFRLVMADCRRVIEAYREGRGHGKLFDLVFSWLHGHYGFAIGKITTEWLRDKPDFTWIEDGWTRDFDTPQEYDLFRRQLARGMHEK